MYYCDRCGVLLHKDNNKKGFAICDTCNDILVKEVQEHIMNNRSKASAKYNKENTTQLLIRLNKKTDADIIAHLSDQDSKQGYIKELIRYDMKYFEK